MLPGTVSVGACRIRRRSQHPVVEPKITMFGRLSALDPVNRTP
jgi:hypothetical protein